MLQIIQCIYLPSRYWTDCELWCVSNNLTGMCWLLLMDIRKFFKRKVSRYYLKLNNLKPDPCDNVCIYMINISFGFARAVNVVSFSSSALNVCYLQPLVCETIEGLGQGCIALFHTLLLLIYILLLLFCVPYPNNFPVLISFSHSPIKSQI